MSINSEIRKIAKAWGVDTKGSSIKDALKDLRTNLPFGTKTEMVAIVPEQSVTGEYSEDTGCYTTLRREQSVIELVAGKTYIVVINSKSYKTVCELIDDGYIGEVPTIGDKNPWDGLSVNMPFYMVRSELNTDEPINSLAWNKELGETITLAIYEEQEVAKPIDIKYLPIEELKEALGIGGDA